MVHCHHWKEGEREGAKYLKTKENITNEDICETWKMMIEGIKHRGKTSENEKTMIDTLVPAYLAFKDKVEHNEDLKIAFESAESAEIGRASCRERVSSPV